jgi:hypothetical protein
LMVNDDLMANIALMAKRVLSAGVPVKVSPKGRFVQLFYQDAKKQARHLPIEGAHRTVTSFGHSEITWESPGSRSATTQNPFANP